MCLIIVKEPNQPISPEFLADVWKRNNDGWGIVSYPEEGKIQVLRGMTLQGIQEAVAERNDLRMAIHFRMATHGAKDETMTHPFYITKDIWFMHNGVMSNAPKADDSTWSDTMRVAQLVLKPLLENVKNPNEVIRSEWFRNMMESIAGSGNKLLLADSEGIVRYSDSLWCKTGDEVIVSNSYAYSIKEANGTAPPPPPPPVPYNNDWRDQYNYKKDEKKTTPAPSRALQRNDYADAGADAKSMPFDCARDLFEFIESYPMLSLTTLFYLYDLHAVNKEKVAVVRDLYMCYLFKYEPDAYNEYLEPMGKNSYHLSDKKVYKVERKVKKVESCCSIPEPETQADKEKTNDLPKESAA